MIQQNQARAHRQRYPSTPSMSKSTKQGRRSKPSHPNSNSKSLSSEVPKFARGELLMAKPIGIQLRVTHQPRIVWTWIFVYTKFWQAHPRVKRTSKPVSKTASSHRTKCGSASRALSMHCKINRSLQGITATKLKHRAWRSFRPGLKFGQASILTHIQIRTSHQLLACPIYSTLRIPPHPPAVPRHLPCHPFGDRHPHLTNIHILVLSTQVLLDCVSHRHASKC